MEDGDREAVHVLHHPRNSWSENQPSVFSRLTHLLGTCRTVGTVSTSVHHQALCFSPPWGTHRAVGKLLRLSLRLLPWNKWDTHDQLETQGYLHLTVGSKSGLQLDFVVWCQQRQGACTFDIVDSAPCKLSYWPWTAMWQSLSPWSSP